MFRHDAAHSGVVSEENGGDSMRLCWAAPTYASVMSSPAVTDGWVVFGSKNGAVYCLNSSSGEEKWSFKTCGEVDSSPAVAYGCVFVGSDDGWLYCLNFTSGYPQWISWVGGLVRSSPAVDDDRVFVGSRNHDLLCFNASDGAQLWTFPTEHAVESSPAVHNGVVYFASTSEFIYALNGTSGTEIWRHPAITELSSPCISGGLLYIGSYNGLVHCINASSGEGIWVYQTQDTVGSSPAVAYGRVYVGSQDCNVYCFNASSGEKLWQFTTGYWVWSSPAVANGNVYVGSQDYSLYCLDAATGAENWRYTTGCIIESSPAIADDMLYVGSSDYHLYALSLNATEPPPAAATESAPLGTIVFDALAILIFAASVIIVARHLQAARKKRGPNQLPAKQPLNLNWLLSQTGIFCALLIVAFMILWYLNLGAGQLWNADEKAYAQIAYSMLKRGDYLYPWAYGEQAIWAGKPPLMMWFTSLSYQALGPTCFAARFWSPVFGALSLVAVYFIGKKLLGAHVGLLSVLVLGSFATFGAFASHAMTDIYLLFFMLASMYCMLLSTENPSGTRYAVFAGLFFGLALMTKQLEALLIPLILVPYLVVSKRSLRFLITRRFLLFAAVALAIFLPYVIYMGLNFKDFWDCYFGYAILQRTISTVEGHTGNLLFYFNYLAQNESLLWMTLLVPATALCLFRAATKRSKPDMLVAWWILAVLGFFTAAQTKLYWYILPAMPAFAFAIASLLHQALHTANHIVRCKLPKQASLGGGG
ncbi:MAG: PQQ-binding-like beta-propeller repeat protein [Candidatus Bathyarchaeota archaeon]|nr:PQQ-binding-like beta-propeller repeat protein [Candidatus Bathyarchaeota archaeon]